MCADNIPARIDEYLAILRNALDDVPTAERDEMIEEIRSHILERIEAERQVTGEVIDQVLQAVGDPKELASQYRTEAMLRRAARSRSPWVLLRSTLRWAMTGIAGVLAFLIALVGYGCAAVSWLCLLLKPFFPGRIGLWLSPERTVTLGYWNGRFSGTEVYGIAVRPPFSFALGTLSATNGPVREALGTWLYPVSVLCGLLFVLLTTWFTRWFITKFGERKSSRPVSSRERLSVSSVQ
jgi:uncharacterized membrane protein